MTLLFLDYIVANSLLTDENLSARVGQTLFKMKRTDLVITTQNRP